MTEIAEKFLFECSKISDLLGCGVRIADRSWITNSSYPACPAEALNEVFRRLSQTITSCGAIGAPRQATWNFEGGKVTMVARPDGIICGFVLRPDTGSVDLLAQKFLGLQF